jgi:hypothetical protein
VTEDTTIKLAMTGKLSYEDDITVVQAAQIISYLHSGVVPIGVTPASSSGAPEYVGVVNGLATPDPRRSGLSPRDALESAGAKTNPEKIVAFALYVERQGSKDTFTTDDIKPLFRQAREPAPKNLSRDLDAAVRLNWIAQANERGEFYVTEVAADALESGFDSIRSGRGGGTKAKPTASRRPRKTSIPTPDAFKDIEITPSIDDYINYHKVKTKTDKYLWAINAAKLWDVESLTNSEIIWLTDKLGAGISPDNLGGCYRDNYRRGYVNKTTEGKTRMTPAGTEHLVSLSTGPSQ